MAQLVEEVFDLCGAVRYIRHGLLAQCLPV